MEYPGESKEFNKQQAGFAKDRKAAAKASKGKTYMGRPVHELDKEQGKTGAGQKFKRSTSDGYMPASRKKAKSSVKKGSFIDRLEAHKAEARSFDDGTWKPKRKGQTFIQALEEHKSKTEFD